MHRVLFTIAAVAALSVASVQADTIYVTSRTTGRLMRLDSSALPLGSGTFQVTPTVIGDGLQQSAGLVIGSDGNLYMGDSGDGELIDPRIQRFTFTSGSTGTFSTAVSLPQLVGTFPTSIAFRPQSLGGEMLVGRYGPGAVLSVTGWQTTGTATNYTASLDSSIAIATAADGTLYVGNNAIQSLPVPPYPPGSVAIFGPIVKFDANGANQQTVANNAGPSGLYGPTGLLVDGNSLYAASVMNGNLYRTDLTNTDPATNTSFLAATGAAFGAGALARLSNGDFLTGNTNATDLLYRFTSAGDLAGIYQSTNFGVVGGIAVQAVPEPGSLALAAIGIGGAAWASRCRRLLRRFR